jgi:hypothetical protein
MATTSKMTWNRLKNDSSISKAELPKIAKAFGITPPKGWDTKKGTSTKATTGKSRSRTAGSTKVGPTKAAAKKTVTKRTKPSTSVTYRTKPKSSRSSSRSSSEVGMGTTSGQRAVGKRKSTTTQDAGPEQAYKKRIKLVKPGGRARGTAAKPRFEKVKADRPTDLYVGSKARGKRTLKKGPGYVPPREQRGRGK